jgi:hypothetical protein
MNTAIDIAVIWLCACAIGAIGWSRFWSRTK